MKPTEALLLAPVGLRENTTRLRPVSNYREIKTVLEAGSDRVVETHGKELFIFAWKVHSFVEERTFDLDLEEKGF